jgi:hypothetical protein
MIDQPDDYHRHEALDRTHLCASLVSDFLIDHPWLVTHPELHAQAEQAMALLSDLYQKIGEQHFDGVRENGHG